MDSWPEKNSQSNGYPTNPTSCDCKIQRTKMPEDKVIPKHGDIHHDDSFV